MVIRETLCFEISRRLIQPPSPEKSNFEDYFRWRFDELAKQWRYFSNDDIAGKEVLDFACGVGSLAVYLARLRPKRIVGIELGEECIQECEATKRASKEPNLECVTFVRGEVDRIPMPDASFDTILAFDCLEHLMEPLRILREWHRVLRPGGKVLIWWSPFRSPWGPHMEAVVPIPWAHVIFGERAIMRTAERIYELDEFVPRPWHFEADGTKKPNVWRQWSTFAEQGYINELTEAQFKALAKQAGLELPRLEPHTFESSALKRVVGAALLKVPVVSEYMTSFYIVELQRPA